MPKNLPDKDADDAKVREIYSRLVASINGEPMPLFVAAFATLVANVVSPLTDDKQTAKKFAAHIYGEIIDYIDANWEILKREDKAAADRVKTHILMNATKIDIKH